jgi:hypothetical protein
MDVVFIPLDGLPPPEPTNLTIIMSATPFNKNEMNKTSGSR